MTFKELTYLTIEELYYLAFSLRYKFFTKRWLMIKYKVGDCFIDKNAKDKDNFIYITAIMEDYCDVKFTLSNAKYHVPLYSLRNLVKVGNIYKDENLKILFLK